MEEASGYQSSNAADYPQVNEVNVLCISRVTCHHGDNLVYNPGPFVRYYSLQTSYAEEV